MSFPTFCLLLILLHPYNYANGQASTTNKSQSVVIANLEVALSHTLKLKDGEARHDALKLLGGEFAKNNPQRGWVLAMSQLTSTCDKETFSVVLLRKLAENNPEEALHACTDVPEGEGRLLAYTATLTGWAKVDPVAASLWVTTHLKSIYRRTAAGAVGRTWVANEPEDAARWALAWPNEIERIFILGEVLESWALEYGPEAADWVGSMVPGKMRDLMMSKVVFRWGENFPKTAAEWIMKNPDHNWLLPRVVAKWAKYEHATAALWLKQLTNEDLANECKVALVAEWAQYNPRDAYDWIRVQLKGDTHALAMNEVLQTWAEEYPKEALEWINEAVPLPERTQALAIILQTWSMTDNSVFSSWLDQQKPGLEKDLGLEQVARMMIHTNPQAAMNAATSISNPVKQKELSSQLMGGWKAIAPEEAAKWSPLPYNNGK